MRKNFALLLGVAGVAAGCTSMRTIRRPLAESDVASINADVRDREIAIGAAPWGEVQGTRLVLDLEKATWEDAEAQPGTVPVAALRQIRYLSAGHPRAMGALQGLGLGLLAGAATGAAIGFSDGDDQCPATSWCLFRFTAAQKATFGALLLGGVGLIAGTVIGSVVGARTTVEFQ